MVELCMRYIYTNANIVQTLFQTISSLDCSFLLLPNLTKLIITMQFEKVTAIAKGNVYFDGKVISHVIILPSGEKKSFGVILPGEYHFGTGVAELMEITSGSCSYVLDETSDVCSVAEGSSFAVGANSGFTITVTGEPCQYICSYIAE